MSRGKVLDRLFELRTEVQIFLTNSKSDLAEYFTDEVWLMKLAYLADIFAHLNKMSLELQGEHVDIFKLESKVKKLQKKLSVLVGDLGRNEYNYLPLLRDFTLEHELTVPSLMREIIDEHCKKLQSNITSYFPAAHDEDVTWIRDPFNVNFDSLSLSFEERDELINLSCDDALTTLWKTSTLERFWCSQKIEYPHLTSRAIRLLLPFTSTYLCETGFSSLIYLKNKYRNRLSIADDLRLRLTNLEPDITSLVASKQAQGSH